jgi:hypothetical protein
MAVAGGELSAAIADSARHVPATAQQDYGMIAAEQTADLPVRNIHSISAPR